VVQNLSNGEKWSEWIFHPQVIWSNGTMVMVLLCSSHAKLFTILSLFILLATHGALCYVHIYHTYDIWERCNVFLKGSWWSHCITFKQSFMSYIHNIVYGGVVAYIHWLRKQLTWHLFITKFKYVEIVMETLKRSIWWAVISGIWFVLLLLCLYIQPSLCHA
jgi:hypothetical protein